jgi:hypothetical protein
MLLVLRLLLAGMLLFLLTDMPGSFLLFVRWYALGVCVFSVVDAIRHGLHVHALVWILLGLLFQPFWVAPLDPAVWKGIYFGTAVWCIISVIVEEFADYFAVRRAKAEAPQPKVKEGMKLKGERVKRGE